MVLKIFNSNIFPRFDTTILTCFINIFIRYIILINLYNWNRIDYKVSIEAKLN